VGITDLVVSIATAILLLLTEKVDFVATLNDPSELVSRIFLNTII
jgi:hypothetical protein